jgi:hypothetical protein
MRTELEVAQQEAQQGRVLAQQRFSHQLLQQQIRNKIEQARTIEDASRQHAELVRLRAADALAERRARELSDEEHEARRQSLALANAARRRELERVMEWEEELAQGRKRDLLRVDSVDAEETRQKVEALRRGGDKADAIAQHEKLLRTIDADQRHELELARLEITRAESFAALPDTAKLALAPSANAAMLGDFMKTQVHATMRADQLAALSGVVAAAQGIPSVAAPRRCTQGHAARDGDVFCAACGASLA